MIGLGVNQRATLIYLYRMDGGQPQTVAAVAAACRIPHAAARSALNALRRRRYVGRHRDPLQGGYRHIYNITTVGSLAVAVTI